MARDAIRSTKSTPPPSAITKSPPALITQNPKAPASKYDGTGALLMKPQASATPTAPSTGQPQGSYSYGGGGGSYGGGALSAVAAPAMNDDQWLAGDATYQAQLAALQKALSDSNSDFTNQQTKYDTDYNDSLKNLGWIQPLVDDPSTPDINEAAAGKWNFDDLNTSAGRAYQNQQNDFAGRGLLQSTLYANANDNLTRSLNDQLGGINTAKQNFLSDLATQQTTAQNQNNASQQQARADALARMAASLAL